MCKRVLVLGYLFITFFCSPLFAQSIWNSGNKNNTSGQPPAGTIHPVISSQDFKNKVSELGQKNDAAISQEVKEKLKSNLPNTMTPPMTPNPAPTAPVQAPPPATITTGPIGGTGSPPPTEPESTLTMPVAPPATETTPTVAPTTTTPTSSMPATTTTQSGTSSSVYTGFSPGKNTKPTPNNTTSPTSTGGWDIKY